MSRPSTQTQHADNDLGFKEDLSGALEESIGHVRIPYVASVLPGLPIPCLDTGFDSSRVMCPPFVSAHRDVVYDHGSSDSDSGE